LIKLFPTNGILEMGKKYKTMQLSTKRDMSKGMLEFCPRKDIGKG